MHRRNAIAHLPAVPAVPLISSGLVFACFICTHNPKSPIFTDPSAVMNILAPTKPNASA